MTQKKFTNKELLYRIDERVGRLQTDVAKICAKYNTVNKRVDKLEDWRNYVLGMFAVISAVFGLLGRKVLDFFLKQ